MDKSHYKRGRKRPFPIVLPEPLQPVWQAAAPYLAAIVFFLAVCLSAASTVKTMAVVCVLLALGGVILRFPVLRDRFYLPLAALAAFVVMNGISTLYAASSKLALAEFLKILLSFCLALFLLAFTGGEGAAPGRRIAALLSRGVAIAGLVSIDMLSTHLLSGPVLSLLNAILPDFRNVTGMEVGVRMTSLYANPNVFASCAALGVLLSLGLALSSDTRRERNAHVACLYVNSIAFLLAFSMGASVAVAVAFLAYLALERKERRAGLFVLMLETLVLALAGTALASTVALQAWTGFQPIPLLCVIGGAAALCLADSFVGQKLERALAGREKILLAGIAIILVALVAAALAAYNLTGSLSLPAGKTVNRAAYPEPGAYTVKAVADKPVSVTVRSQNRQETMMHTGTTLYQGDLAGAAFTVPEDSLVVYIAFYAPEDVVIDSVLLEGAGEAVSIPLDYKLLPDFIANRLQGLFANQNAIQRLVFFEDGLKLFQRNPVLGRGLGGFENGILGVQSFYYETRYAHNHYIQTLAETGVIGFLLFVLLLLVCGAAILWERRREDAHPLTAALGAALVMMAAHAATEVIFSFFSFLPVAFGVFALINLCCGRSLPVPWMNKGVKTGTLAGTAALITVFFFLLCGNMMAADIVERMPTYDNFEKAISMDKFAWTDYMLSYVTGVSTTGGNEEQEKQAVKYAERLAKVDSNIIPLYLAEYYLHFDQMERGLEMAEKYLRYVSADSSAWDSVFDLLEIYESSYTAESEAYNAGVLHIADIMAAWNQENLGVITLNEKSQAYLARLGWASA